MEPSCERHVHVVLADAPTPFAARLDRIFSTADRVYLPARAVDRADDAELRKWEARCVERAREGDRAAFAELYERYAPELYRRVLYPRLGNRQAAEDALAETFRTLLEKLDQYEDHGKGLFAWLARVATNKATDMHRVKGRTSRALTSFEGLLAPLLEGGENPGSVVETRVEAEHLSRSVALVMDRLNPRYRRAIELRFLEDKPREECAAELEVKIGTFDVLILRALRAFRREWEATVGGTTEEMATP